MVLFWDPPVHQIQPLSDQFHELGCTDELVVRGIAQINQAETELVGGFGYDDTTFDVLVNGYEGMAAEMGACGGDKIKHMQVSLCWLAKPVAELIQHEIAACVESQLFQNALERWYDAA